MNTYLNLILNPAGQPVEANVSHLPAHKLPPVRYRTGVHTHQQLVEIDDCRTLAEAHEAARQLCKSWDLDHVLELLDNHTPSSAA